MEGSRCVLRKGVHMITPEPILLWGWDWDWDYSGEGSGSFSGIGRHTVDGSEFLNNHLGCQNPENNGIEYQPQPVSVDFSHQQYTLDEKLGFQAPLPFWRRKFREIDGSRRWGVEFSCHGPWYNCLYPKENSDWTLQWFLVTQPVWRRGV